MVVDEGGRYAMEVAHKSKNKGIIEMPTTILDPLETRGVKVASKTGKQRPKQNVGTVAGRATKRASAGRSTPIRTNLDRAGVTPISVKDRTTPKAQEEPKMDRAQPF